MGRSSFVTDPHGNHRRALCGAAGGGRELSISSMVSSPGAPLACWYHRNILPGWLDVSIPRTDAGPTIKDARRRRLHHAVSVRQLYADEHTLVCQVYVRSS